MTDSRSVDRRTALQTVAGVAATALGASTADVATADRDTRPTEPAVSAPSFGSGTVRQSRLTGVYSGTVDRVVDGEYVVLLAEGGRVREQFVVSRRRYPDLSPGDSVTLVVFRGHLFAVW